MFKYNHVSLIQQIISKIECDVSKNKFGFLFFLLANGSKFEI